GVLLTGGYDLPPEWYGQELHPRTKLADPQRLEGSRRLAEQAVNRGLPVLGICMGCQLLNVILGGDLIQDIPDLVGTAVPHSPFGTFHRVRLDPGSRLFGILEAEDLEVNSSHHQAVGRPGSGLRPVAWAPDGVIEALESEDERFLLAVQWHPERMLDRPEQRALFQAFVDAARCAH
ncbi:MAG: gamma-glutamyl-gamma-aminobutyrate hydrolase family protein, partial [Chloroflexia bacterium]